MIYYHELEQRRPAWDFDYHQNGTRPNVAANALGVRYLAPVVRQQ